MQRLITALHKEILILVRDRGGLAMLFIMPLVLILIMSLIQDAPFKDYQEAQIPLLLINKDDGQLGEAISRGLHDSRIFSITSEAQMTEQEALQLVTAGSYKLGVIIPVNATEALTNNAVAMVKKSLHDLGLSEEEVQGVYEYPVQIRILFDPASKRSLKTAVKGSLSKYASKIESQIILTSMSDQLKQITGEEAEIDLPAEGFVQVEELNADSDEQAAIYSNSVQHNVPAWTIFAMFFIVIPLATNIIKERDEGALARLKTLPGSFRVLFTGKFIAYFFVCIVQLILMLAVGVFILPLLGLATLQLGSNIMALALISFSIAFAAIGYGLMVGTLFNTHQQAAVFGSISVVIMAALGGIWVPSYVMPEMMQNVGRLSPLNWGLEGFNDIFLRGGGMSEIYVESLLLITFFFLTIFIAFFYNKLVRRF